MGIGWGENHQCRNKDDAETKWTIMKTEEDSRSEEDKICIKKS
nr:hypothetical protein [Mycoplasmopsis bovis]